MPRTRPRSSGRSPITRRRSAVPSAACASAFPRSIGWTACRRRSRRCGPRVPVGSKRAAGFGKEVRRRVMIGTYVLSAGYYDAYYLRAQKVRTLIKRDFETNFDAGIQAMLTPTTPSAAFGVGEKSSGDPIEMYLNDVFTVTVNMAGLPGISVPAGIDRNGLPLGLQLIGRPFDEENLFALGHVIEQAAGRFSPERWW